MSTVKTLEQPKPENIKAEIITVSPGLAQQWLEKNETNRDISEKAVKRYKEIMKAGNWQLNGEAIKISDKGNLLDGQHRLTAVIKANIAVPMMVITGLPQKTFDTIDTGRKRTGGDVITIKYQITSGAAHVIAAAAKIVNMFSEHGVYKSLNNSRFDDVENHDVLDILNRNTGIIRSYKVVNHMIDIRKLMPLSLAAAMHYLFCKVNQSEGDKFFFLLNTGADMKVDHPVLTLRRKLMQMKNDGRRRARSEDYLPYVTKAWQYFMDDKYVSVIRIDDDYVPRIK